MIDRFLDRVLVACHSASSVLKVSERGKAGKAVCLNVVQQAYNLRHILARVGEEDVALTLERIESLLNV